MSRNSLVLVALLIALSAPVHAEPTPLEARARDVCGFFKPDPTGFDALFTAGFMAAVGKDKLFGIARQVTDSTGRCTAAAVARAESPLRGEILFTMEKSMVVPATLGVEAKEPHLIESLLIKPPVADAKSLDDVVAKMKALPGTVGVLVTPLDGGKPLAAFNDEKPLALGSAFKLYLLAELARQIDAGTRKASDVVLLRDEVRSFSSPYLERWPAGAPLTLHTVATMMIAQSDNTASDLLLATLGRDAVEAGLEASGDKHPQGLRPFLSTAEAFRLKLLGDDASRARWAKASAAERRKLLASLTQPLSEVKHDFGDKPLAIETVEWFASAGDLCRVMGFLRGKKPLRDILSVNRGLDIDAARWPSVGFKGGSEPGVINLTFLLEDAQGKATCVAATWNNPKAAVDDLDFAALVGALIRKLP